MKTSHFHKPPASGAWSAQTGTRRAARLVCCFGFLFVASLLTLRAQPGTFENGVTVKDHAVYRVQNGHFNEITNTVTLPCHDVQVDTNATFTVGKGKERQLQEGQTIRDNCWMTSPDGSAEPVYNHIAVKAGKVYVVRDGDASVLSEPMTCTNNLRITPDGFATYPGGVRRQLQDGQLFQLDGTPIPAMDAVTLINGQVVVQKSGALIRLQPVQIMGMDDGSRIHGNGMIRERNGSTFQLQEGQTVLLSGIRVGY